MYVICWKVCSASYLKASLKNGMVIGIDKKSQNVYKRDDFNFPIMNFPFISSNIPAAPAYGVYIS